MRDIKSVCIIGAGPSGLATAKYLLAERAFSHIKIFEQRARVGGLWNYTPCDVGTVKKQAVPQTSPHAGLPQPIRRSDRSNGDSTKEHSTENGEGCEEPAFLSPLYDRLETNIPRGLMGFSDLDWPDDRPLFPKHEQVLAYLEEYAKDVEHLVSFSTQVVDVRKDGAGKWLVKTQDVSLDRDCRASEESFDAVAVASGHFEVPYIPPVSGIEAWNKAYSDVVSHSKFYRKPEDYAGKKVIVVGNSASGVDIGAQIATMCRSPLLRSLDVDLCAEAVETEARLNKPRIEEFVLEDRSVRFADGSVEAHIDAIIYCTGYLYFLPFLSSLDPPPITTGTHVENLFQHIFYRPDPSLAFLVLNQKVIPFPMAEAQAAVIARGWSGRLNLPAEAEMVSWENKTKERTGKPRDFHLLPFPKDADYINMLHDWAVSADDTGETHQQYRMRRLSATNGHAGLDKSAIRAAAPTVVGKEPRRWGEKEYWMRERFPAIKQAYQSFGEGRYEKRSLEDVGFDFEEWKRERADEGKRLL